MTKIVGVIWVILGLVGVMKPETIKNRLKKKMSRALRRTIYGAVLILGLSMAGSVLKIPGILSKLIGLVGLIIAVRAALLFTSKTSSKLMEKLTDRSLQFFRIWGLFILITGLLLILL